MLRQTFGCAGLLALAALPATADGATAAVPSAPNVSNIPATLQPLVQSIASAHVTSERYTVTSHDIGTETRKAHGRRRTITVRSATTTHGEASLSPARSTSLQYGSSGTIREIEIGSIVYLNDSALTGGRRGLWIKAHGLGSLFPLHENGGADAEVSAGGAGPYAGLLNLLATAPAGDISIAGHAVFAGQQTTEILAQVSPLALVKGAPANLRDEANERLEVFVNAAGVPVRVTGTQGSGNDIAVESTEVLAVNVPVSVKAPPAGKVISESRASKLMQASEGRHAKKK